VILLGYNYGRPNLLGVTYMVVLCVLLGCLLGWLRMRSGTIWAGALAHGTFNAGLPAVHAVVVVRHPSTKTVSQRQHSGAKPVARPHFRIDSDPVSRFTCFVLISRDEATTP
jgi:hypothetical protein